MSWNGNCYASSHAIAAADGVEMLLFSVTPMVSCPIKQSAK